VEDDADDGFSPLVLDQVELSRGFSLSGLTLGSIVDSDPSFHFRKHVRFLL